MVMVAATQAQGLGIGADIATMTIYGQYDKESAIDLDSYNDNENTMRRHNDAKYGQTIVTIEIVRRQ